MKTKWEECGEKDDWAGFNREVDRICNDSSSPEEMKRRLVEELGYPLTDGNFKCKVAEDGQPGSVKMKNGTSLLFAYRWVNGAPVSPFCG